MKNQIKFPLTLDNYLNPSLGKQDRIFSQDQVNYLSDDRTNAFTDIPNPVSSTQLKAKKKANPRLRIL
jgi:hypothetical protein